MKFSNDEFTLDIDALGVFDSAMGVPMSLKDIYVPLRLDKEDLAEINDSDAVERQKGFSVEEAITASQFIAFSEGIATAKSLTPMTDEEMLADLHKEVKSFIRVEEGEKG